MKILHLRKRLVGPSGGLPPAGVRIRPFGGPEDVAAWLALRVAAFQGGVAAGRPWTAEDFRREFLARPWWTAASIWLAEIDGDVSDSPPRIVGSVVLGRSGRPPADQASMQWLMVAPDHQRRGIGGALVAAVEDAAIDRGAVELVLETHADWREAVRLYERLGYAPVAR